MNNSASNSSAQPIPITIVTRSNKLQRDPLRRALLEALTRPAPSDTEDDHEEEI